MVVALWSAPALRRALIGSFITFRKAIAAAMIDIGSMSRQAATRKSGVKPPHSKGLEPAPSI
ncbi:MAG: hypothetical protein DRH70_09665, partial [Candidatus Coatesbacteria bacterium]